MAIHYLNSNMIIKRCEKCILLTMLLLLNFAFTFLSIDQSVAGIFDNGSIVVTGLKNNTNITIKDAASEDNTQSIINYITAFVAIIGIIIGFITYLTQSKESRILRKKDIEKDIIFPLIKEFDKDPDIRYAKDILDSKEIKPEKNWLYNSDYYNINNLSLILRDHNDRLIKDPGESAIRHSFDVYLDFLYKVKYLLDIRLLNEKHLEYYSYYLKNSDEDSIKKYIEIYHFPINIENLLKRLQVHCCQRDRLFSIFKIG